MEYDQDDDNGEYWQTVGQWEQWQDLEAQTQPDPIEANETYPPFDEPPF